MYATLRRVGTAQFSRFVIVAGLSLVFDLVFYTFLISILRIEPVAATPVSQILAMIFNFALNRYFTFAKTDKYNISEFLRYALLWLTNLVVTAILMWYLTTSTAVYPTVLRFIIMLPMFGFNFLGSKTFVFRGGKV